MGARKNASVDEVVLEYAYSLFADKGIDGASLADIAAACGISKGTLYYYYPNKGALVGLCAEACIKSIDNALLNWVETLSETDEVEKAFTELANVFAPDNEDISLLLSLLRSDELNIRRLMRASLGKWQVMLEMGALRLDRRYSERLSQLSSALLYMLIGSAAAGSGRDETRERLRMLLG